MEYALDKSGNRVSAIHADNKQQYYCPVCNGQVIVKNQGKIKSSHFAHRDSYTCTDTWHYDMSEWHMNMQSYFDEQYREVVCTANGKTHRADILKDGVVIEFQHSAISAEEYCDRNEFYHTLGYKVVWVFDVSEEFHNGTLYYEDTNDGRNQMRWKYPKQVLQLSPSISDYAKEFALFFWIDEENTDGGCYLYKVIWSTKNPYGEYDLKRVIVSDESYEIVKNMNPNDLFRSKKDILHAYLESLGNYCIKVCGIKGHPRKDYICPIRNEFGLHIFGEKGCSYCKYCGAIKKENKIKDKSSYIVYCCYPKQVNETIENPYEPGLYECQARFF